MNAQEKLKQLEKRQRAIANEMESLRKELVTTIMPPPVGIKQVVINEPYYYLSTSIQSSNKAQLEAFDDAFCVMWELRKQPGIVVPDGSTFFYIIEDSIMLNQYDLSYVRYTGQVATFSPAFETKEAARNAAKTVGINRIKKAAKTLAFMTPESRGEVV